jgi:hypothetical protein
MRQIYLLHCKKGMKDCLQFFDLDVDEMAALHVWATRTAPYAHADAARFANLVDKISHSVLSFDEVLPLTPPVHGATQAAVPRLLLLAAHSDGVCTIADVMVLRHIQRREPHVRAERGKAIDTDADAIQVQFPKLQESRRPPASTK